MCTQPRLRSALAFAQSDLPLLCAQWEAKDPRFLHADSEYMDGQAVLSRHWVHRSFCWLCHASAHIITRTAC